MASLVLVNAMPMYRAPGSAQGHVDGIVLVVNNPGVMVPAEKGERGTFGVTLA